MQFMLKKRVRDLKNAFELTHFPKSGGKDSTENFTVSTLIYKWYWYNTYSDVVHKEFFEAIRKHMFGLFCRTVTNIWHQILSLESPPHTVINTFRFTPVWLEEKDSIINILSFFFFFNKIMKDEIYFPTIKRYIHTFSFL